MDAGHSLFRGGTRMTPAIAAALLVACFVPRSALAARDAPTLSKIERVGVASVYARHLDGRTTASGEVYDPTALTAAHPSLPFGTRVRVTNLGNHRSVVVRINDRGPYAGRRVIDLTPRAAEAIGIPRLALGRVRLDVVPMEPATAAASAAQAPAR